jgi:hypothetical protein
MKDSNWRDLLEEGRRNSTEEAEKCEKTLKSDDQDVS